jgi:Na+/glutamate symporter
MMSILSTVLTGAGSIATGGVVGGLFSLIGLGVKSWANIKEQKEQNRHKEEILKLTNQNLELESKYQLKIKDKEIDGKMITGELGIIKEGYRADASESAALAKIGGSLSKFGLSYKATVRPTLAYFTTIFITYIFYKVYILVGGLKSLPVEDLISIFKGLISTITGFWTAVGMYYFFNRPIRKDK